MPLQIVRDDITHMQVDAIVNAANERLLQGGGVCGAIFAAAGPSKMQEACDAIGHCNTGSSVATSAFNLPAKHVIHTVGPVWQGGRSHEEFALRSCYRTALQLAHDLGDESIAFPLISSGIYGYPKDQAIDIAIAEIKAFLNAHEMDVFLTIFDAESLRAGRARYARIAEYIDDHYVYASPHYRRMQWEQPMAPMPKGRGVPSSPTAATDHYTGDGSIMPTCAPAAPASASASGRARGKTRHRFLERLLKNLDESFSTTLLTMIDQRGLKDSDVYKRANMSRQHFSKIRSNKSYQPKKHTVLALAIAMELTLEETRTLLERAGFALTHADERDVIVEFFIKQGIYDIHEINLALYAFDQPLLG